MYNISILGEVSRRSGPKRGGTAFGVINLCNSLYRFGLQISLISTNAEHLDAFAIKLVQQIKTVSIGRGAKPFQLAFLLLHVLKDKPDILLARNSRAIQLGLFIKRIFKKRMVLVCAIHQNSVIRKENNPGIDKRRSKRLIQIGKYADGVVTISPGLFEAVKESIDIDQKRLAMIPNPAYNKHEMLARPEEARHRPNNYNWHLITIGRLSKEKRQADLIHAIKILVNEYNTDVSLTILGDGSLLSELKQLSQNLKIDDRIFFQGFVSEPLNYLASADLFVLSSEHEAFGYVLVEALAMGVPIVSTDCPYGPRYILEDGKYGILVEVKNPQSLAEGILKGLQKPIDKDTLQSRAKHFESQRIAKKYYSFFKHIVNLNR